jgi:hypothetical protein
VDGAVVGRGIGDGVGDDEGAVEETDGAVVGDGISVVGEEVTGASNVSLMLSTSPLSCFWSIEP